MIVEGCEYYLWHIEVWLEDLLPEHLSSLKPKCCVFILETSLLTSSESTFLFPQHLAVLMVCFLSCLRVLDTLASTSFHTPPVSVLISLWLPGFFLILTYCHPLELSPHPTADEEFTHSWAAVPELSGNIHLMTCFFFFSPTEHKSQGHGGNLTTLTIQ